MDSQLKRILDVNINRLTEGLRVAEEYCRFVLFAKKSDIASEIIDNLYAHYKKFIKDLLTDSLYQISEGKILMHTCDDVRCVNLDHLILGTHKENMADRKRKNDFSKK